jgi:hypothetical protein
MAANIKLGARPKTFARNVKTTDLDGADLLIPVTYKYRTLKEYGAWIDTLAPEPTTADGVVGEDGNKKFSAEAYVEKKSDWQTTKILQLLDSWGLDVAFDRANVKQLCDESPAAAEAIIEEYRAAIIEGRLGN